MDTSRKPVRTAVAAALLTGALTGGTALAAAAPALAAPSVTTAAASTAAGARAPIAGSDASSRQIVAAWYSRFLDAKFPIDRYPGSSYWVDRLDSGVAPAEVLAELRTTNEYAGTAVDTIYRAYLKRSADTGANYWIDGVTSGAFPIEWVEQNVATSDEYLLRTSGEGTIDGSGVDTAVEEWYAVVLDRSPSKGERAYWLGQFGSDSALGVFRQLWYTPEAVEKRIQSHYTGLLDRTAGAGEVRYWFDREVASDTTVVNQIGSSAEYANKAR